MASAIVVTTKPPAMKNTTSNNYDKLFDMSRQNTVKMKLARKKMIATTSVKFSCEYDLMSGTLKGASSQQHTNEIPTTSSSSNNSAITSVSNPNLISMNHLFVDTTAKCENNKTTYKSSSSIESASETTNSSSSTSASLQQLSSSNSATVTNHRKVIFNNHDNSTTTMTNQINESCKIAVPRLNRSKSLNINRPSIVVMMSSPQPTSSNHQSGLDFVEANNKPELHPRSIYLSYDQNQKMMQQLNQRHLNHQESKPFIRCPPPTRPQNETSTNRPLDILFTYDNNTSLTSSSNNTTNSIDPDVITASHLHPDMKSTSNHQHQPNHFRNFVTKSHFRSFINKKNPFKVTNNSSTNSTTPIDEFSLFGLRKSITELMNRPVNMFSLSKAATSTGSKPTMKYVSSSESSSSSSSSGSVSISSASSIPSSPVSRANKQLQQQNVFVNITNTACFSPPLPMPVQEYECIHDDENERRFASKSKIVDELVQTEMDYYKAMKMLYDVYLGPNSETEIDYETKETIFCNLKEIVELSSVLLNDFEANILNKCLDQVKIGKCFLKNIDQIKLIYSYYAQYKEYSNSILEKNEKINEIHDYIENGLKIIRQNTNAFDLNSLLLKPIQRVLKYPLLLQELIKNTEETHEDYEDLVKSLKCMQDVASYINEIKRRHELIVKYGRKDKDHTTISTKMSKLTMHSMIKKSNRISIKLSNVLKINGGVSVIADEKFDHLEEKFANLEKLIKSFIKDSIQNMSSLKEFLKAQTICAESLQEYYSEDNNNEISTYVHINANVLNEIFSKNINLVHEKVLQPLKNLLKFLETPSKLIEKRHDKLLDYEFAKSNMDKLKEKYFIKTNQENLIESRKNYEALNNQLVEEMPNLISKCLVVFEKCFQIYMLSLKNIYKSIEVEISNLIKKSKGIEIETSQQQQTIEQILIQSKSTSLTETASILKESSYFDSKSIEAANNPSTRSIGNTNNISSSCASQESLEFRRPSKKSSNAAVNYSRVYSDLSDARNLVSAKFNYSAKMEKSKMKTFFNSALFLQKIKNLTHAEKQQQQESGVKKQQQQQQQQQQVTFQQTTNTPSPTTTATTSVVKTLPEKQDEETRIRMTYLPKESLFRVVENFAGLGLTSSLSLEKDDIVYVLKRCDPCGSAMNWFVDNGIVKGLVPAAILKPYYQDDNDNKDDLVEGEEYDVSNDERQKPPVDEQIDGDGIGLVKQDSFASVSHSYVNEANKKEEICIAMYSFESISESTLTVNEGDRFRVLQKHDDNMNSDWWLLERLVSDPNEPPLPIEKLIGYVPANYVSLLSSL